MNIPKVPHLSLDTVAGATRQFALEVDLPLEDKHDAVRDNSEHECIFCGRLRSSEVALMGRSLSVLGGEYAVST